VAFHQDPFSPLQHRSAAECTAEVAVVGEPSQDDLDRALPLFRVVVDDECEDSPPCGLADERRVGAPDDRDHRATRIGGDLADQVQGVCGVRAESDEGDIRGLAVGDRRDVPHLDG